MHLILDFVEGFLASAAATELYSSTEDLEEVEQLVLAAKEV